MAALDYARLKRVLLRCDEIAKEPDANPIVLRVFTEVVQPTSNTFITAHDAIAAAESASAKERREAVEALRTFEPIFREARSVVLAYRRDAVVPGALSGKTTDTDRMGAIRDLVGIVDANNSEGWAQDLSNGRFGQRAPNVIREVKESITATADLANAQLARAQAYGPAYEDYLAFKDVVRNAYGANSRQYRRIHVRANDAADDNDPAPGPAPEPSPGPTPDPDPASKPPKK